MGFIAVLAAEAAVASAGSLEISDLFSSIESADITLQGEGANATLQLDLIHEGEKMASRNLAVDGPGTWAIRWPDIESEKGSYDCCAALVQNSTAISKRCYGFYYGGAEPIRFDVRDFRADSRGMHLAISASDSAIVDIYYMLLQGGKAVYVTREQAVAIAGSYASPISRDYAWKQILQKGQDYEGRVKIVELKYNQTRAFMNQFQAEDDASITETYQDETGASATVLGNSRVPFVGYLRFALYQNGSLLNITEKKTPVLLAGDDDTVEITWNGTLEPGIYQLRTILLSRDGSVMDLEENVIEAEPLQKINATETAEKSGLPAGLAALAMIAALLMRKRR
ncbi:MAG: hypothetical protein PHG75_08460 [Syntrophomonas sp.]|nr:hypothetical protein [Syntrophomonas sp.]